MASPIVNPDYMSFVDWANQMWLSLGVFIPVAESEEKWQEWAANLFAIQALNNIPNPNEFENWRDWAARLINCQLIINENVV